MATPAAGIEARIRRGRRRRRRIDTTLLALVQAVGEVTDDQDEVVATVLHLIRSGRVRLTGSFRGRSRSF